MIEPNVVLRIGRWEWQGRDAVWILWGIALAAPAFLISFAIATVIAR